MLNQRRIANPYKYFLENNKLEDNKNNRLVYCCCDHFSSTSNNEIEKLLAEGADPTNDDCKAFLLASL